MTRRRDSGAAIVLGTGEGAVFATSRLPDGSPSTEIGRRMKIAVLPGDGIGPEVVGEALRVLDALAGAGLPIETEQAPIGGAGYDAAKHPPPPNTPSLPRAAAALFLA